MNYEENKCLSENEWLAKKLNKTEFFLLAQLKSCRSSQADVVSATCCRPSSRERETRELLPTCCRVVADQVPLTTCCRPSVAALVADQRRG